MKKNLFALLFSAALLLWGCSLDRYPLTGPSSGTFPASEEEAIAGLLSCYKNLANNVQQYEPFPNRWMDQLTDIGCTRTVLSHWPDYTQSIITSNTSQVKQAYARIYKTAGRVHMVLDKLDNIRDKMDEDTFNQIKIELLCIRAYVYDQGVQLYGDIPFIDHSLSLEDYAYARTPKAQVIDRIISDMDEDLFESLPVRWPKGEWGTCRLGRAAAYALKARICLEWGRYEDAARCSARALALADGVYDLTPLDLTYYPTHAEGEPDQTPLFGFDAETDSEEWLWAVQFNRLAASNTHTGIYTFTSRVHNGAAGAGPSMAMMDTFQCTDGKSIVDSPLYDWTHPWANRDPRLDLWTVRPGSRLMGIQFTTDPAVKTVMDYTKGEFVNNVDVVGNKSEYGPNGIQGICGFLWRKYSDPAYYGTITGTSYEDDLDVPIIRLAEVLLVDAEANIEWTGGDLERARAQINRVRKRAGMPEVPAGSREDLRSALRYERKVELCAEGFRWFDIRRWKEDDGVTPLALKAIDGPQLAPDFGQITCNAKPTIDKNWIVTYDITNIEKDAKGNVVRIDGPTFDGSNVIIGRIHTTKKFQVGKDELWPFPYDEMTTNPLIGLENNNPGY